MNIYDAAKIANTRILKTKCKPKKNYYLFICDGNLETLPEALLTTKAIRVFRFDQTIVKNGITPLEWNMLENKLRKLIKKGLL